MRLKSESNRLVIINKYPAYWGFALANKNGLSGSFCNSSLYFSNQKKQLDTGKYWVELWDARRTVGNVS